MSFGRLGARSGQPPMSDINMTPLIDVMLVLLVIFIVSAPLMATSLRLDLPRADAAAPSDALQSIAIAIDENGRLYLGDAPVEATALAERARQAARANPATEVQLRADSRVPYGRVAELIGLVQEAGLRRIGFVTEARGPGAPAAPAR
ncbi:MAG: ExbD/TolR family protein [Rubrivivax sp.]